MLTPPTATRPSARLRILYVDDVPELRELVRLVFARQGHTVDCAVDGLAAIETLSSGTAAYDLIITDHHMPRMNGLTFVGNLRQLDVKSRVVVFSSELDPSVAVEYERLHVDRVLFKPVYPSFLRQMVAEMFPATAPAATPASVP
ncbi:response regulator [Opitutus sp. ER46]|uniref:response regulator n=1 Tax=Opitutus sp. ER46 TaxID=2161864 RepID=UPI000D314834|nr:response regulator [Opitutus sp. ER46]PTX97829.1 hypothetical protein DB354_06005 [Opitutus sp. ER46]